jgi:uncharacterized phage protein (TIGR01671 family)
MEKFRAFNKRTKKMWYLTDSGDIDLITITFSNNGWWMEFYNHEDDEKVIAHCDNSILMRWIGQKDSVGKDIYIDDVVYSPAHDAMYHIYRHKGNGLSRYEFTPILLGKKGTITLPLHLGDTKIAGNIHENPEMGKLE